MIDDDKQIQDFFRALKNVDRDMLVIEDFKDQMRKVQGRFDDLE